MPLAINLSDQDTLRAFIQRRHPEYWELHNHIKFLEETYEGGREWFTCNIHRGVKEGLEEYKLRLKRAYRFNHSHEVVDLIDKYIFKSTVARKEDAPQVIQDFWKNSTLFGLDIEQFMRVSSKASSVQGKPWIFVDSNASGDAVSVKDQKATNARCYAYIVGWRDVLDMGFDENEKLQWVLVREHKRDDGNPITGTGVVKARYRLWTTEEWFLFDLVPKQGAQRSMPMVVTTADGRPITLTGGAQTTQEEFDVRLIGYGTHPLQRVPGFPLDNVIGDCRYAAPSLIADTAYLDKAVANYLSNLDTIIQDQTFSQLAMPAQNMMPGDDKYKALLEMGTKRMFIYDGEGGVGPQYISPDPKQAHVILQVINKIISEIYHSLGMGGERTKQDNAVGIDNSSGVAKAYDFEKLNSLLTTKSGSLQNAENEMVRLVMAWNGNLTFDQDLVKYPDTFDVRSLYDEFTVAERLALIDAPKTVRQEQMKQVVEKLFPELRADLKTAMLKDIQSWPITGQDMLQITGTMTGNPSSIFPAKGIVQTGGPKPSQAKPAADNKQGQVPATK